MKAPSKVAAGIHDGVADATALDRRDLVESHCPEAEYVLLERNGFVEIQCGEPDVRKSLVGQRIILSSMCLCVQRTIDSSAATTCRLFVNCDIFDILYVDLIYKCL
jgi:hypothetical protein